MPPLTLGQCCPPLYLPLDRGETYDSVSPKLSAVSLHCLFPLLLSISACLVCFNPGISYNHCVQTSRPVSFRAISWSLTQTVWLTWSCCSMAHCSEEKDIWPVCWQKLTGKSRIKKSKNIKQILGMTATGCTQVDACAPMASVSYHQCPLLGFVYHT